MHQEGVYHRDIKPANILLDKNFNLKICDFGHATTDNGFCTDWFGGTLGFMSPEIEQRMPHKADAADLFALGVTLFTIYVGWPPFERAV